MQRQGYVSMPLMKKTCKCFDLLEEVYEELDFKDHLERIYNMDKTGVPIDPPSPKNRCSEMMKQCLLQVLQSEIADTYRWL